MTALIKVDSTDSIAAGIDSTIDALTEKIPSNAETAEPVAITSTAVTTSTDIISTASTLPVPVAASELQLAADILSPEDQIRAELLHFEAGIGDVLARGIRLGNLFRAQKDRLRHGDFGPWLQREFPDIPRRTVNAWMKGAKRYNEQIRNGVANFKTLRELLCWDAPGEKKHKRLPSATGIDDKLIKVVELLDRLPDDELERFCRRMLPRLRPTAAVDRLQFLFQDVTKKAAPAKRAKPSRIGGGSAHELIEGQRL